MDIYNESDVIDFVAEPRTAIPRKPRTNLGRRLLFKKEFKFISDWDILILTHEEVSQLFSFTGSQESLKFKITDLSDEAEIKMEGVYLNSKSFAILLGWQRFVIKHGRPDLGEIWFYKEYDIWGNHVRNAIKLEKPKGITKPFPVGKHDVKKDDDSPKKGGGSCSEIEQHRAKRVKFH